MIKTNTYQQNLGEEKAYLKSTIDLIKREIATNTKALSEKKTKLIEARRDMWENTVHFSNDFARLTEMNQYLSEVNHSAANYRNTAQTLAKYQRIIDSPYFGRFDFLEDGYETQEKIYVGLHNVVDPRTHTIYVYDWRAPISSIFYRHELGKASYLAPQGEIYGDVSLKRQYKIQHSQLKYFFDCSIKINDEILQEILSRNTSPKMRNIVETIQKEQDLIIRDTESNLLIVQGVAGSGKTSVALHRIAFLLYEGLDARLNANNIIIISPNDVFSTYISSVLPELGEDNVQQITFDDIEKQAFADRFPLESKAGQLESLLRCQKDQLNTRAAGIRFKGSQIFLELLDRYLKYYAHRMIPFVDVYLDGQVLMTGQQLKNRFLNNKADLPMAKQLQRIENILLEQVRPIRKRRLKKIEEIVAKSEGHELEIKPFSRLLSIKEAKRFMERVHNFTQVDYWQVYLRLFNDPELFVRMATGLDLPDEIDTIVAETKAHLQAGQVVYEDAAPLLYLKLKIEGATMMPDIRQVVVDEAQDYYPMHYRILKLLFGEANYTVLGDVNQAIEKNADYSLYDEVIDILDKSKSVKLFLSKGYRSSYEITCFARRILGTPQETVSFERHEEEPEIIHKETETELIQDISQDISRLINDGYESVAVICKTQSEADRVHRLLKNKVNIKLIKPIHGQLEKGAVVVSSYMAKGLEFDAVIVYGVDNCNYSTWLDRHLLYISCTRALHKLVLYYTGEDSPFLEFAKS